MHSSDCLRGRFFGTQCDYTTRRNAFIGHARQLAAVKLGRLVLMLFYFYFILAQLVNFCTNKQIRMELFAMAHVNNT